MMVDEDMALVQSIAQGNVCRPYTWSELQKIILTLLQAKVSAYTERDSTEIGSSSKKSIKYIEVSIEEMPLPPFTLQRLCELLSENDTRHYDTLDKFLRALEKSVSVVSPCIDPALLGESLSSSSLPS